MSGLLTQLNSAAQALGAHSRAIETSGRNLANVNNPNYARQRVQFGDRGSMQTPYGAQSLGLEALSIQQLRDSLLDRQLMREISLTGGFTAQQDGYRRAQASLGQSIDRTGAADATGGNGIAGAIDTLFNAFQSFSARPTDSGERQSLVQKAAILTDRLRTSDQRLAQAQLDLNGKIGADVTEANRLLSSIASLNLEIGRFELHAPGGAVDLRDQRQARLEELAAIIPIDFTENANGQIDVTSKDGSGGDVVLVTGINVQGVIAFTGTGITAGATPTALALGSGSIDGAITARDGAIQTLRDNLDALANQLVTSVNNAYNPSGATGDFFDAGGVTAATIALDSTLTAANLKASDGGAAGDNTIALAVAQLASTQFSTGAGDQIDGTFSGFFADSVMRIGEALATANARVEDQGNIERLVRTERDSVSAVSLDEEMADLMRYQRAFQASSRVFTIVDGLLELVVTRLGRT